ncbi:ATP-binding cassette domain-containing protein [Magnetospirillum molischianum]|uniref:ABC transporter, ATP-binding protein n=1 Tax=Magnetospirillum molischianum DSM 120 TaxID=1150626 RepID=H8FY36_MAGML|nr:ATP-binding cassette domain-containing protein [Magnetospirillum molischianum]CCG43274.1 ABC transporter, ATP-binding protein [Magnetospirillum molischianum DSM 120]
MTKYVINKAFSSSVQRTDRVLEVGEAFGIGLSDRQFVIYDNLEIEVRPGDVVYITGQSGSGKSLLLRELQAAMKADGLNVRNIDEVELKEEPLVDQVGTNMTEALQTLSKAGINDAYLVIRTPSELSDGQRYRLRLAKLIESNAEVWVADEFGAVLDRVTAKVVAFNMQKLARQLGKTLIVATTHTDLDEELGPNLVITKRFHDRVDIRASESDAGLCPICGEEKQ